MTRHDSWRTLRNGTSTDVVLAVDFFAPGRVEASFDDLAPRLTPVRTVQETGQPPHGAETGMMGEDYLSFWLDGLDPSLTVRGILGFCVGGVYASALGARLAQRSGVLPAMVLFDPEPITGWVLRWQYHKVLQRLAQVLSPEELSAAEAAGGVAEEEISDLPALGDRLIKLYAEAGHMGLARFGLDQARREEMLGLFDSYMSYLVGASQITTAADTSTTTVISSDAPTVGVTLGTHQLAFDMDRHELLRAPEVAAAVSGILG